MAMKTEAPDPRTFKSWEDAFQYPIPVVRKLEKQLRSSADENREKLRSLVGTSYRSLLDTAETIIDMEVRMEEVESKLSKVGRDCNSRSLDRIASNAVKMDVHNKSRDLDRYTFASQLAVLRNAPTVMKRLMKVEGSYLLTAKVIVISRLLHKALSQSKDRPPIVDQLWDKLRSTRDRLLRRIDKRLASSAGEASSLVESMCAYALATSSTPTDVLHHFLKVRGDKIESGVRQSGDELAKHGISSLKLCIQTCQDTQTIFPRRLSEALAKLKTQPLVQDPDVRALYELNLDVHDRWIGDEARNYTPWPRHDELQRVEAERLLHKWSKKAISEFLKEIKNALEKEERLKEVANLRQELIETWILSGSRMAGVKSANVLDDLRDTMNEKLEAIVRSRSISLKSVVIQLSDRLKVYPSSGGESTLSLWTTVPKGADLSDGAQSYKTTILNTHQGRDASVIDVVSAFDKWMESVLEVKGIVKSMKEARWEDTFVDDLEEDSDDEFGESKQTLLNDDDPRLLEEVTQEALSDTMQNLGRSFSKIISQSSEGEGKDSVQKAVFILRVVREIGDRIPRLRLQDRSTPLETPFTTDLLKPLYNVIASQTVQASIESYKTSLSKAVSVKSNSHILWEGHPPLPAQPSPCTFRYLRDLNKSMGNLGSDLWGPDAVWTLKRMVCDEVTQIFLEGLDTIDSNAKNDSKKSKEPEESVKASAEEDETQKTDATDALNSEEIKNHKLKQLLFDMLYIQRFAGSGTADEDSIGQLVEKAGGKALDEATRGRLRKNAADYARKTYLLFALLA